MASWLEGPVLSVLEKGLDASSLRQKVLADNVANVDTPEFKRSDVDFQAVLGAELENEAEKLPLQTTAPQHLSGINNGGEQGVKTDNATSIRNDGNNVDIDREMANVAENGIYYNAATRTISSQLNLLRMVIQEKP
ncbi:MAG TPA: flagellar basal body rod protein FlgB [Desulfitobacteriaceae bacterium]|nr:flagellar basal body rod protein FlgB [Desulfitobacteriaceae bacterium]